MIPRLSGEQHGFTLIEVLVVVVIIATLAAIALPAFLTQRAKGDDSAAKSHARSLFSEVEACGVNKPGYDDAECTPPTGTGLPLGAGPGQVQLLAGTTATSFTVRAQSATGNTFTIAKTAGGVTRSCSIVGGTDKGGCLGGSW